MDIQPTPPTGPVSGEGFPKVTPDKLTAAGPSPEAAPAAAPAGANQPTVSQPAPHLTAADAAAAVAAMPAPGVMPTGGSPAVAGDVDVIEPEWVDKAEEAIAAHQNDPYGEEEAIEHLQEDYLEKRYGIHVSDPNSGKAKQ